MEISNYSGDNEYGALEVEGFKPLGKEVPSFIPPKMDWTTRKTSVQKERFPDKPLSGVVPFFNQMIKKWANEGRSRLAQEDFDRIIEIGYKPDSYSYSALIEAYLNDGFQIKKAIELLDDMKEKNVQPNIIIFNLLLSSCFKNDYFQDASKIRSRLEKEKIPFDQITYNILIKGFCKMKEFEEAVKIFKEMENLGLQGDIYTYTTLIHGAFKARRIDLIDQFLTQLKAKGLKPNLTLNNALINGYISNRNFQKAEEVFSSMTIKDRITYTTMIDGYVELKKHEKAIRLYQKGCLGINVRKEERYDALDCHNHSRGSAFIQLYLYLQQKKNKDPFILITGKENHFKNYENGMKKYLGKNLPSEWIAKENPNNKGMLFIVHKTTPDLVYKSYFSK